MNRELEKILKAYDAAKQASGADEKQFVAFYESKLDEVFNAIPTCLGRRWRAPSRALTVAGLKRRTSPRHSLHTLEIFKSLAADKRPGAKQRQRCIPNGSF
jgi:hypothetical protein